MARAVDRDLSLFHRFEQRRLRPGRHAVDFVDEQQVGEDRPLVEREGARRHVEDVGADDVGRHQVGRALHALELQAHDARERPDRQRLGEAGNALEQRVTAADDREQQQIDHLGLPDDDLGELAARLAGDLFECAHRLFLPPAHALETRGETLQLRHERHRLPRGEIRIGCRRPRVRQRHSRARRDRTPAARQQPRPAARRRSPAAARARPAAGDGRARAPSRRPPPTRVPARRDRPSYRRTRAATSAARRPGRGSADDAGRR